ncbi:MAG: SpoIID/LytB domain-containing protein [Planctomycetota bacterium]|nr:SpoIID/LytB domain-containing protein [Planctomycetota bacterium]
MKRNSPAGRFRTLTCLVLLAVWLSPCTPPRQLRPLPEPYAQPTTAHYLPHQVWILLSGQESQPECQVQLTGTREGASPKLEFRRVGQQVVCSDGRKDSQLITPLRAPFEIAGRQYLGNLKVQAHKKGGLRVFVEVGLEHYVEGVVAAELPLWSSFPAELQAQSVAVRTYAVTALSRQGMGASGFLWDGVQDQAYHGTYRPGPSRGEQSAAIRLRRAVEATRGQVLLQGGELLDVRYHASCGGQTADRATIFPGTAPSAMVACTPCAKRARTEAGVPAERRPVTWKLHLSKPECLALVNRFGLGTRLLKLAPSKLDGSGRWQTVRLTGNKRTADVPLDLLRKNIGYGRLKSGRIRSLFPATGVPNADGLDVTGLGRGHGVWLCQEGLHDYAAEGMGSQAILEHYYPGSRVQRLDPDPRR